MCPGDRGGHRDAIDGGTDGAGDVDPDSFFFGAGPAQFADERLALGVGAFGSYAVPGAIGSCELAVEFPDPAVVGVPGCCIRERQTPAPITIGQRPA